MTQVLSLVPWAGDPPQPGEGPGACRTGGLTVICCGPEPWTFLGLLCGHWGLVTWIRAPGLPGKVGAGRPGLVPCLGVESGSVADSAPAWEAGTSLRQPARAAGSGMGSGRGCLASGNLLLGWGCDLSPREATQSSDTQRPCKGRRCQPGRPASSHSSVCLSSSVIVTEKTNILLRYLHQQWDKKVRHAGVGAGLGTDHWWLGA